MGCRRGILARFTHINFLEFVKWSPKYFQYFFQIILVFFCNKMKFSPLFNVEIQVYHKRYLIYTAATKARLEVNITRYFK